MILAGTFSLPYQGLALQAATLIWTRVVFKRSTTSHVPLSGYLVSIAHGSANFTFSRRWAKIAIYGRLIHYSGKIATIADGPNAGLLLRVPEHTSHAHIGGTYEREVLETLSRLIRPGMVCYDFGASIGYITLLFARHCPRVYAFEPSPVAIAEMRAHLDANKFTHVEIVPNPVSDHARSITFSITENAYGSGITSGETQWSSIKVDALTLDEFCRTHEPPDIIKIDIEGEEANALRGASGVLSKHRPIICCELHSRPGAEEVVDILTGHGYVLTLMDGSPFVIPPKVIPGDLQIVAQYFR